MVRRNRAGVDLRIWTATGHNLKEHLGSRIELKVVVGGGDVFRSEALIARISTMAAIKSGKNATLAHKHPDRSQPLHDDQGSTRQHIDAISDHRGNKA